MANALQNKEGVPENQLRKQLAVAVRSIRWSYAIFWSISTKQQGVLEWGNGYYNGDIKTMKTVQPMELNVNKLGLKRTEQLRELYGSLSEGDMNQQARRPSAALSPEDLTDAEWYYLVCMSFTFNPGQGLPGRALANNQHIWLCDAHNADSKVFSRSLLAKSASIQTVVCFPFLGGVIELGVTEMVSEDPALLQHIKTVFLEFPMPICSETPISSPRSTDDDEGLLCTELDHDVVDSMALEKFNPVAECMAQPENIFQVFPFSIHSYVPKEENEFDRDEINELQTNICEELFAGSTHESSNVCEPNQHTEDSFMLEGVNNGASLVKSWQLMDDEFSNCVHGSMNSSDCVSQAILNTEKFISSPKGGKINNLCQLDIQECKDMKPNSLDLSVDNLHYTRMLSVIFKNSNPLTVAPCARSGDHKSSFVSWTKEGLVDAQKLQIGIPQKMLKKIVMEVAWLYSSCSLKSQKGNGSRDGLGKPEVIDTGYCHSFLERREKMDELFLTLRSLVPSINKFDKASILGDTIKYLKELERRVEELESCRESAELETKGRRKHPDIVERTSDNYGNRDIASVKKPPLNKRKACNIDEMDPKLNGVFPKDGFSVYVTVCTIKEEVLIEMHCPWRECLLLEIIDAISNLEMDVRSVQSSTTDGILNLTLMSKFRAAGIESVGIIKEEIQRVLNITA